MKIFFFILAWMSYFLSFGYEIYKRDTPQSTLTLTMACFFLLMAIWYQNQKKVGP